MSPMLFILQVLSVIALVSSGVEAEQWRFPECTDPTTNWMSNQRGMSPCEVAANLEALHIKKLPSTSSVYTGPRNGHSNPLQCSTVSYSMVSACAVCQGGGFKSWKGWASNCIMRDISVGNYPLPLPPGIEVPTWAYMNVEEIGIFDVKRAKAIASAPAPSRSRYSDMVLIGAAGGVVGSALVLSVLATLFFYRRHKLHQKKHLASNDTPESEPLLPSDGD
ncbi:hypothetical protein M422DRAFT_275520 [Sphaerobolus stellatus SS14]|uniref:Transmembrane protein n=1 Tax=Sphaerobolus stellatus (strain SS14) TaxID=990650 RepID=A0A0C9U3Y0_SPHS4|nr:hypothetical protein M422DRAFT_275520 [Sphaerobolus stellatus SS14]